MKKARKFRAFSRQDFLSKLIITLSPNFKPSSSQEKILKNEDGSYTIYLRAPTNYL